MKHSTSPKEGIVTSQIHTVVKVSISLRLALNTYQSSDANPMSLGTRCFVLRPTTLKSGRQQPKVEPHMMLLGKGMFEPAFDDLPGQIRTAIANPVNWSTSITRVTNE